jgi:RND family efflux transporter MFP subunit
VFLNDIVEALNKAVTNQNVSASMLASYQSSIAAARSEVISSISSLVSAKSAYDSAASGASVAQNSASSGTSNDIASAQANVKSALGALNAAQANLEKTIIRAPISGTIVSLPITRGGYVSSFSEVAQISNPSALEIEVYVTSDDAKTLSVGGKATIEGDVPGVIVFIAPALDPSTGKIQIKIGIPGKQSSFADGDAVAVSLERSAVKGGTTAKNTITIPIAAAKITPAGPVVFTVSSSTLEANPVFFGPIIGDRVTVINGLTPEMVIVTDARGLSDGQEVVVDSE